MTSRLLDTLTGRVYNGVGRLARVLQSRGVNMVTAVEAAAKAKAAADFWGRNPKGGYTLLPEVYRDDIVASGAVVLIHAVRDGSSKHGPTWFADIEYRGEIWTMPQSHNQVRDRFLLNAIDYIAAFGPLPAVIISFDTPKGTAFDFASPPAEYLDALASGTGEIGVGDVSTGFDDVPF